MFLCLGGVCFV